MIIKMQGLVTGNFGGWKEPFNYREDVPCIVTYEFDGAKSKPKLIVKDVEEIKDAQKNPNT